MDMILFISIYKNLTSKSPPSVSINEPESSNGREENEYENDDYDLGQDEDDDEDQEEEEEETQKINVNENGDKSLRRFSMPPMLLSMETNKNKNNNNLKTLFQKNRILFQIDANKINKKLHTNKHIIDENEETKRRKQQLLVKYEQHIHDSFSEISNTLKHYELASKNRSKNSFKNNALHRLSNISSNSEEGYYSTLSSSSSSSSSSTSTKNICSNVPVKLSQEDSSSSSSSSSSPKMVPFHDDYENVPNSNNNNKSFFSNAVSTLLRRGRLNASFNDLSLKAHNIEQNVNNDDVDRTNLSKRIKQFLMSSSKKTSSQMPKRSSSTNYFDRLTAHVHFNLTSSPSASSSSDKSNQFLDFKNEADKKQTLNTNVKMLITKFECKQTKF